MCHAREGGARAAPWVVLEVDAVGPRNAAMTTAMLRASTIGTIVAGLLMFASVPAHAAQDVIGESGGLTLNDVRLGFGLLPISSNTETQTNGVTTFRKRGQFDLTGRTSVQWMLPLSELDNDGGWIWGLELSRNRYIQDASVSQPQLDVVSYAITAHFGLGWVLAPHFHLEVNPLFGLGVTQMNSGTGLGRYSEYGGRFGIYWTSESRWQLGVSYAYLWTRAEQSQTTGGVNQDTLVRTDGATVSVQLGYRF